MHLPLLFPKKISIYYSKWTFKKASRHRDKGKRTDINNTNILETEKQMMNYRPNALKKVEF